MVLDPLQIVLGWSGSPPEHPKDVANVFSFPDPLLRSRVEIREPSYDETTLAAFFQLLSPEIGPVLRESTTEHARELLRGLVKADREPCD